MTRRTVTGADARGTVDVINFWCVAILLVSALSVAAVVGAAVVTGEFDEPDRADHEDPEETDVGVIVDDDGAGTSVTWSDPGEAQSVEIRDGDAVVEQLDYVGESTTVERDAFEVVAVHEDGTEAIVDTYRGND